MFLFHLLTFPATDAVSADLIDLSGIAYDEDARTLYLVGNLSGRTIFYLANWEPPASGGPFGLSASELGNIPIDVTLAKREGKKGADLEGVAVLNGKPLVVSEWHSRVLAEHDVFADYSSLFTWTDDIGLEGVSIESNDIENSRIAFVYEGGDDNGERFSPCILFEELSSFLNRCQDFVQRDIVSIELDSRKLSRETCLDENVVLRVPDLVWCRDEQSVKDDPSFIALLTCGLNGHFDKKWLCKVSRSGRTYFDLSLVMSAEYIHWNWEGICWLGTSQLLLCADKGTDILLYAIDLPKKSEWIVPCTGL